MKIEIRTDMVADICPADVFEVKSVDGNMVVLERVYRPKPPPQPSTLGVSVGDSTSVGDSVR